MRKLGLGQIEKIKNMETHWTDAGGESGHSNFREGRQLGVMRKVLLESSEGRRSFNNYQEGRIHMQN